MRRCVFACSVKTSSHSVIRRDASASSRSVPTAARILFGRNEACGIRCVYHGWKFDVHGECVELPTLPDDVAQRLMPKARIRALQVRAGDVIWAYCGDGQAPQLPQFEFATLPAAHRFVSKKLSNATGRRRAKAASDTAHFSYLHAGVRDGEKISLLQAMPGVRSPMVGENKPPNVASSAGWPATECRGSP